MTVKTELKEYKELLEKQLKITKHAAPICMTEREAFAWSEGVRSTALYALEMLPETEK